VADHEAILKSKTQFTVFILSGSSLTYFILHNLVNFFLGFAFSVGGILLTSLKVASVFDGLTG
jgi:hypothetical protein